MLRIHQPGQVCLLQVLLSSDFPSHLLPDMHLLWRVSVPRPQVTEQVHDPHDDQANKILMKKIKLLHKIHTLASCVYDQIQSTYKDKSVLSRFSFPQGSLCNY